MNTFSDTLVITDGFALNVPMENATGMQPYPNPATNTVIVPVSAGTESVRIINAVGQDVLPVINYPDSSNVELNLSALPPGVYFVQVTTNGALHSYRIMKQ